MHRKIKIAQIITRMDWGGSPDLVRILCRHLDKEKYDITLISGPTMYASEKTNKFLTEFTGSYIIIPQLRRDISLIRDTIAFIHLFFILLWGKFDIVHTHTAKAGALGRLAARLAGVKVIVHSPHGHNLYGYFKPAFTRRIVKIERFLSRFTDRIIAGTQLEKNDYLAHSIGSAAAIDVIYAGLELEGNSSDPSIKEKLKRSFDIPGNASVVGMIGRLEHVKDPECFVRAALHIAQIRQDVYFILIGEGSLKKSLQDKVNDEGYGKRIIFSGWRNDAAQMMAMLDIMVLTSLNEAVGLVLVEAQSQGIPVVASNTGGIPETVKENETGILVSPGNADKFVQAILFLLDHPDKRMAMGEASRAWVESRFKAEQMTARIYSLYEGLLRSKH